MSNCGKTEVSVLKISVIMPVFNSEKYLEAAITSVLSQDVELEIIAVDDASRDSSGEILSSLAERDSRIKPFYNTSNLGVAEVRNIALSHATGDYLAFCDADDTVPNGAYSALLSAIGKSDVAIGAYTDATDTSAIPDVFCRVDNSSTAFFALFSVPCLWTKLIRREFVIENNLSFDSDMKIGEDVVFLANLATKNPSYAVTNTDVYRHINHIGSTPSLIHTYTLDAFLQHIECRKRLLSVCRDIPECRSYVFESFSAFITDMLFNLPPDVRAEAFSLYRDYMLQYCFLDKPLLFRSITGVPYDIFIKAAPSEFFTYAASVSPREKVLWEFEGGTIGFRWIIKYFKKWLKYKIRK